MTTGLHTTLSGQTYQVTCRDSNTTCEFGDFILANQLQRPAADGSVYVMSSQVTGPEETGPDGQLVLPFLADQP